VTSEPGECPVSVQDAELQSTELLERIRVLERDVRAGARLIEEATAESSAMEVRLGQSRREIERLERVLQKAHAGNSPGMLNGHEREWPPSEVAVQMVEHRDNDSESKQLRSENEAMKERLAASNRRFSGQGQASICLMGRSSQTIRRHQIYKDLSVL